MMAKTDFTSVDEYIAAQPDNVQAVLQRLRKIIRKAVPAAVEVISYQMPGFRVAEGGFLSIGGWKEHYALYGATQPLLVAFERDLARYQVSKGAIRFPLSEPIPVKLIERIAKFRAKEVASRVTARTSPRKNRK